MSNSKLATYTLLSPHCTKPRSDKIRGVAIHCTAGSADSTAKTIAQVFQPASRKASCNYAVGGDGSVALVVDEANRAWCTSNTIDHSVISVEVASDSTGKVVRPAAVQALIKLLADICRRNDIKQLLWTGRKADAGKWDTENMIVHRWYANKSCPGDYLYNLHPAIAASVNTMLNGNESEAESEMTEAQIKALVKEYSTQAIRDAVAAMAAESTSAWAQDALAWASANGITDGAHPGSYCTREQVVTMLYRLYGIFRSEAL